MCIPGRQQNFHGGRIYYVLGMHIVYVSASIMGCCVLCVVGE